MAESAILPIMLNQKIMNPSYGGNKSGACFIEVKCSCTFSFAQTQELKPLNWNGNLPVNIFLIYYSITGIFPGGGGGYNFRGCLDLS